MLYSSLSLSTALQGTSFHCALPQMVNEAVRRRASSVRDASKPLSLEYMADRLDVDDPLTGYVAVTPAEGPRGRAGLPDPDPDPNPNLNPYPNANPNPNPTPAPTQTQILP